MWYNCTLALVIVIGGGKAFLVLESGSDSGALVCISPAPRFNFQTSIYSEEIFLQLVVIHTTKLVVNSTLMSLHCVIKRR